MPTLREQNRRLAEMVAKRTTKLEDAISVLKQAERKLVQALGESEAANRRKSDFLAEIGHEMRTPLNAIVGFSKLLLSEDLPPKADAQARHIHEAGCFLLDLVGDIAETAEGCGCGLDVKMAEAELPEIIHSCLPLVEEQAEAAKVLLAVDIAPDFPTIVTDARRLKQVLVNLIANAIKFTRPGGSVTVKARADVAKGAYILIISDTGVGMTAKEVAAAKSGARGKAGASGAGIGLPLTRRIVERLGGSFDIESARGRGTVVALHFPNALAHGGGRD
jgi:signal transduction histidine kinase